MYFDFNEAMVFRSFTNKDNPTNNSTRLTINTTGIITQNIFADSITVTGINLKTYTDTISGNLFNNYNTKTQSDNIYYNKSYIDSKLNTLTGSVTTGTITVNNIYFAYSTLPTLTSTSIGYTINYTNAITSVAANEFVNSAVISIPVGIYMVNAYASISTSARLALGINTATSAFSDAYNYTSDINQASTALRSISYTHYLTVSTTTNFYFVFQSSLAGNLNGSLNGKFIRIA